MQAVLYSTLLLSLALSSLAQAGPQIVLDEFRIEPTSLKPGDSFTVSAQAKATGVKLGSFVLRTANDVKQADVIPGFSQYVNNKYYVADGRNYLLQDNGRLDGDPREGRFSIKLSTQGWKPGRYAFAFFASCRPNPGPMVAARHDFAVVVEADEVRIEDLGATATAAVRLIQDFSASPAAIRASEPIAIRMNATLAEPGRVEVTTPYCHAQAETLPGFQYDGAKQKSFCTLEMSQGAVAGELKTEGWPAGVHHLQVNLLTAAGKVGDSRSFAVKVAGPSDRFQVTVEQSRRFGPGTHFGRFVKLRDGTILCQDKFSRDGGQTWQSGSIGFGEGAEQLRDGRILGLEYRCLPIEGREGWYSVGRFLSSDSGRSFARDKAAFHVPEAKAAMGHAMHLGPLFMRSILQRGDGSLVALTAGWFKSDTALCPYGRGRPYSRTYVCQSDDGGLTWQYLTTIGYDQIGSEGYNEGSMRRLPSGEILAVLRTGSESDRNCHDNPIMWSASRDEGRTWSKPQRTGVDGAYPSLAVLADGLVVMSYGRPGAMLIFSADSGRTWTDPTCVDATPYSGYTDVVALRPGELLVGFGVQGYLDPETNTRDNQLRLARVCYQRH